jgi:hypothetical protein
MNPLIHRQQIVLPLLTPLCSPGLCLYGRHTHKFLVLVSAIPSTSLPLRATVHSAPLMTASATRPSTTVHSTTTQRG